MPASTSSCSRPAARSCATRLSCGSTAKARLPASAARACSRAASTPTPPWSPTTRSRTAPAARCSSRCSTRKGAASFRARSSYGGTRKRPMPRWRPTRCCCRKRPRPTTNPSSKFSPTTCSVATARSQIIVRRHAQKTDAKMATHALLLSETAEADNKPELEIFADDVQCGHGATSGALDEDLLFYLKARGIPAKEAQALLIQAFVGEAVEGIEHAGLRDALIDRVVAWLEARG